MDFHSLLRRDLQFLCKRNKIPANMTNLAMADALKALEIVEGLNEYMNQSDSNVLQSPTSVAKQPPNTATRTTRRKTAIKAEPQLGNRSCHMTSKSLAGESDQETIIKNVAQEPNTNNVKSQDNVAKTPAARSTRKALAATSCSSKVQESKKDVLVQSVYSTRRSTRLLEKCMADLSLKTKETLDDDKPEKNEETEQNVSAQEKIPADSEERSEDAEVIPGRDLSASMEKEWKMLKNDSDQVTGGLEIYVDLGDIDARNETNNEKMNEVMSDEKESEDSLVQVDKQEETLQAICEEGLKKKNNDQDFGDTEVHVDLGDIPALEYANTETNNDNKEWKNDQAFDSLAHQEIGQAIQENDSEPEKINNFDEDTMVDQTDGDGGDSEIEPKEDNSGVDSDGTISEADSTQAVLGSDTAVEEMNLSESEGSAAAPMSPPLLLETEPEEDKSGVDSDGNISEADSSQAVLGSDIAVDLSESEGSAAAPMSPPLLLETEAEENNSGVDSDGTISEADSNQAVLGSDIAVIKMNLSESEGSAAAPMSPPHLPEEAIVKTAPLSPFAGESISVQFPRPNKSTTTPSKKMVNVDNKNKENNMEMMMNVNKNDNGESKGEAEKKKKKKKVEIDEEILNDVSIRQLVKMVKELSIKSSNNRTALQILPGNNQIAE